MRPWQSIADATSAAIQRTADPAVDATSMFVLLGIALVAGTAIGLAIGRTIRHRGPGDATPHGCRDELLELADVPDLGFARFDAALVATSWNHGMQRLLSAIAGSNGDPNGQRDWWAAIHPDDRPRLRTTLRGLEPGRSTSCDFRIRRDHGRWWSMRGTLHRYHDGTSGLLFRDDSQRASIQRSIDSAARLRSTIEIAVETLETADDLDQAMCELLALIGEELDLQRIGWFEVDAGNRCRAIANWSPERPEAHATRLSATLSGDRLARLQSGRTLHDRDGEVDRFTSPIRIDRHLDSILVAEFDADADQRDEITLIFGRFCDALGRRFEREEAFRDRETFAANRSFFERSEILVQLAGGLRHDFNNVAFAIGGRISLLLQRTDDPVIADGLGEIREAIDAASHLIERFARADGEGRPPIALPIHAELEEITNTAKRLLPRRLDIELECDRREIDDGPLLDADPEALQRLILNLVVNSRDAIHGRGRIRISARPLESDHVEIRVDDDGPGIPAEDRERLLQTFDKGSNRNGPGIGLSNCHRLATRMRGCFTLEDSPLGGLGARLVLPLSTSAPCRSGAADATNGADDRLPGTVLVVEDNTVVREVITAHLEQAGANVMPVSDALTVEERIQADPRIEMLIMDIDLPGRSGIDAIQALRARGHRIPCVLITGGAIDPPPLDRTTVLRKPFGMESMLATLRSLLAASEPGSNTECGVG